jgi:hypothetical protein
MRSTLIAVALVAACGDNHAARSGATDAPPGTLDAATDTAADAAPDAGPDVCAHRVLGGTTLNGSVQILNQADVDALAGVQTITGNLVIGDDNQAIALTSITLPDLQAVGGNLDARVAARPLGLLDEIHLPELETVGGFARAFRTVTDEVVTWDAPRLRTIGSFFEIEATNINLSCVESANLVEILSDAAIDVFTFPRLQTAGSNLQIKVTAQEIDLPELVSTADLELAGMNRLATLSAPKLVDSGIDLRSLPALSSVTFGASTHIPFVSLDLPSLHDVVFLTGTATIDALVIEAPIDDLSPLQTAAVTGSLTIAATHATALRMPNVTALTQADSQLQISGNPSLTTLELPNLTTINAAGSDFASSISSNPMLKTCTAQAIADRVVAHSPGLIFTVSGDGPGTCP